MSGAIPIFYAGLSAGKNLGVNLNPGPRRPMRRLHLAAFIAALMVRTIGAADNTMANVVMTKAEVRERKLQVSLLKADFVKTGDDLPLFVKSAIKQMPNPLGFNQVVLITDLGRFNELLGKIRVEEALPQFCDLAVAGQLHPQCGERVRQVAAQSLPELRTLNAFVLDGRLPLFINGEDAGLIQRGLKDFALGSQIPVRLLRARLIHERMHSSGEISEDRCYTAELKELHRDENQGLLPNAADYVRQIEKFRDAARRRERLALASASLATPTR